MDEESILSKIQKLIDKAYGGTTEEEAKALLAKADELMIKWSIDQAQLLDPNRSRTGPNVKGTHPERREVQYIYESVDFWTEQALGTMFGHLAEHLHVRIGNRSYSHASCIGYPADLDMLEMFFLRMKMHLISNINPQPDPSKHWVESLVAMKNAGMKWEKIHSRFYSANPPVPSYPYNGQMFERRMGVNFTKQMKDYCERTGTPRVTATNLENWRIDYINGYSTRLHRRLREARQETINHNPYLPDLIGNKLSDVQEFLYQEFPNLRPHPADCDCDLHHKCRDPKCDRFYCVQARKPIRMSRAAPSYRKYNQDAYAHGARVADTADIGQHGGLPT